MSGYTKTVNGDSFPAETVNGETITIVEKSHAEDHSIVLRDAEGNLYKPVANGLVEPIDSKDESIVGKNAPSNAGEAPYGQVVTEYPGVVSQNEALDSVDNSAEAREEAGLPAEDESKPAAKKASDKK